MVVVGVGGCAVGLVVVGVGVVVEGVGVGVPDVVEVEGVADRLGVGVLVAVRDEDDPGEEKIAGTLDDDGPVQAETVAETTTIKVAQLTTVSRTLPALPGMLMRAFMKPP